MEIKHTTDYKLFKLTRLNRAIDEKKVSRFAEESKKYPHLMETCPILVNHDMEILDGQHRFLACKRNDLPIFYIQHPKLSYTDMVTLNKDQKNWTLEDYINHHCERENQNFLKLSEFSNKNRLSIPMCCLFLGFNRKTLVSDIKNGSLQFPEGMKVAIYEKKIRALQEFQKKLNLQKENSNKLRGVFSYTFHESIAKLPSSINVDEFFNNLFNHYEKIELCRGWTAYHFQYKALGIM